MYSNMALLHLLKEIFETVFSNPAIVNWIHFTSPIVTFFLLYQMRTTLTETCPTST